MNKQNIKYSVLLFSIVSLLILLLYIKYKNSNKNIVTINNLTPTQIKSPLYISGNKKVSLNMPSGYTIDERFNSIYLKKNNNYIVTGEIGTNFKDMTGYINDLEVKNRVQITEREEVIINGMKSIKAVIEHPLNTSSKTYIYFFYPDEWTIYSISTDSQNLKEDLDKVAHSFEYKP